MRRLTSLIKSSSAREFNVAETPVTAAAFVLLRELHLIARIPLWIYVVSLFGAMFANILVSRRWPAECTPTQLWLRIVVQTIGTFVVIFETGWGPSLVIGFMFI